MSYRFSELRTKIKLDDKLRDLQWTYSSIEWQARIWAERRGPVTQLPGCPTIVYSVFRLSALCRSSSKKKNKRAANVPSKRKSVHAVLETWMHMANWPACGINSKRRFAVWMVSTERARLGSGWSGGYEALFKTEQSTVLMQKLSGQPALLGTYGIVLVPASLSANPWWWLIDFEPNSVILWGPDCCVCLCRYL